MTVQELIDQLQLLPNKRLRVVVTRHSDYGEAAVVQPVQGCERGGYVAHPYRPEERDRAETFIHISD